MLLAVLDTNWQMEVQCQTNTTWKLSNCISDSDVLNRRVLFHQNRQHQKAGAQLWWDQTRQSAARSQHSVQGSWPTSHDLAVSDTAHPDIHTHTHSHSHSHNHRVQHPTLHTPPTECSACPYQQSHATQFMLYCCCWNDWPITLFSCICINKWLSCLTTTWFAVFEL